jgi:hypothetical protein
MRRITVEQRSATSSNWYWPLFGVAAGALGAIGHLFTDQNLSDEERASGEAVIDALNRTSYHIGIVAGMAAVFCLLIFTAGWRQWNSGHAPGSIAGEMISLALVASAGAMLLGYGFKGSLAVYLQGGMDGGSYPNANLLSVFMVNDFAPYIAWYGVAMAAIGVAWYSLREHRLPIWFGVLAAVFAIVPIAFLVATGLPGFPGVVDPFWMIIFGSGLSVRLRRAASPPAAFPAQQMAKTAL